jgi:hypothetical protein
MPDDDLEARLAARRGTGRYVSLVRDPALGRPPLGGVIEAVGESLVLVQEVRDFHRRGFVVVRRADVVEVAEGDVERLFSRMIDVEGVRDELLPAPALDLDDWSACLRDLKRTVSALVLECESQDPPTFYLGRLTAVTREAASLRYITVEGVLEREAVEVPLDEVTLVSFDDRYSRFFGRHASDEGHH